MNRGFYSDVKERRASNNQDVHTAKPEISGLNKNQIETSTPRPNFCKETVASSTKISKSREADVKHKGSTETAEGTKGGETQELTDEEINEKQREAIKNALERINNGEKLSDKELGNLCEMMMDQYYIKLGYKPLHERVTSLDDPIHQGIDGVYEKGGKYVIVDAKYNSAQLHETKDGRQMSDSWIYGNRLDDAVGSKEIADEIREAHENDPSSVSSEVFHYDPYSDADEKTYCDVYSVDENGYKCSASTIVEAYQNGEPVNDSPEKRI